MYRADHDSQWRASLMDESTGHKQEIPPQADTERWTNARHRAKLVARYSKACMSGPMDGLDSSIDLLALLLYCRQNSVIGAAGSEIDELADVVGNAVRAERNAEPTRRVAFVIEELADSLRAMGHDLQAPQETDPVVDAWRSLDETSTATPYDRKPTTQAHGTPASRELSIVDDWLSEQSATRADDGHMRSFLANAWNPPGERLHIQLGVNDAVRALAAHYEPVLHAWSSLLRPVDSRFLHMSLAWLPAPLSHEITRDQRARVHAAVRSELAEIECLTLQVGPALATRSGVVLDVAPDRPAHRLRMAAYRALVSVFGEAVPPIEPGAVPHVGLAYTHSAGPAAGLSEDLGRLRAAAEDPTRPRRVVDLPVTSVLVVDQDTFGPHGLAWTNEHAIHVGHRPASSSMR
jgi:hypothetical protein